MHALIVTSHPLTDSLTHAVADQVAQGIIASGQHTFEIADLAAEGFDPCFNEVDIAVAQNKRGPSDDILGEQTRVDRAQALILVYPVYWWSFPALLKGWIDRVFSQGWAYDDTRGKVEKKLQHLPVHLIALGGADQRMYARHGYFGAMKLQIDRGIFDYVGAPVMTTELLLPSDPRFPASALESGRAIGERIFSAAR